MKKNLAPIVLFTYNRLPETKKTLFFLKRNVFAKDSNLFIFSDGGKNREDQKEVLEVRNYLKTISGFKSVNITEREKKIGLAESVIRGVSEVINCYGKVIVLEDDLITSQNFLCFMNKVLNFYENFNEVFSVSGYTISLEFSENYSFDVYASYRPFSWGWGTWKREWNTVDWKIKDFDNFVKNRNEIRDFNRGGFDLSRMLKKQQRGEIDSWAIRYAYSQYKQNKFSICPKISKVRSIGFGIKGTNCKGINIYQTKLDDGLKLDFDFLERVKIFPHISKQFKNSYGYLNKLKKLFFARLQKFRFW